MSSHGGRGKRHSSRRAKEKRRGRQLGKQQAINHRENNKQTARKAMNETHPSPPPTDFVRAVLCAMLISMLFSFVMTCISGQHFPVSFQKVWAFLDSSKALPIVFAGVWIVFYFGYMIDDFLQPKLDREVSWSLLVAWFFFAAQVCTVGCLGLSTILGCVGLVTIAITTANGKGEKWRKMCWWVEDICVAVVMLACLLEAICLAKWMAIGFAAEKLLVACIANAKNNAT